MTTNERLREIRRGVQRNDEFTPSEMEFVIARLDEVVKLAREVTGYWDTGFGDPDTIDELRRCLAELEKGE